MNFRFIGFILIIFCVENSQTSSAQESAAARIAQ